MQINPENSRINLTARIALTAIIVTCLFIHLPALFIEHIENDEVIYQTLANRLSENITDYSLQNTPIISQLPPAAYDKPLFHHPPLFIWLLLLFRTVLGSEFQILIPILACALTVLLIYLIGKELYNQKTGILSALIFTLCPIMFHASTKIWIDPLLTFLCTLSVYLGLLAAKKEKLYLYILNGITFGLAITTKTSGLLIIFPLAYLFCTSRLTLKNRLMKMLFFLIPGIIIASPWFLIFYNTFGTFLPWWIKPTNDIMQNFPFNNASVNRPWHFYFSNIFIVSPIYIFSWISIVKAFKKPREWLLPAWVLTFIIAFTIVGISKGGYITRYVLPATPALAILSARFFLNLNKPVFWIIFILLIGYGLTNALLNTFIYQMADVSNLFYFFRILS